MKNSSPQAPITTIRTAAPRRDAEYWSAWFWGDFFTDWLTRVQDGEAGVFDALDADGNPDITAGKTLLAQARTLFTLSHVALLSKDSVLISAARKQAVFLVHFRKACGLYRCKANRDGSPTGKAEDEAARSYDHAFVILGLVTWNRVSPSDETAMLIDDCWEALQSRLTDPATGLLRNDDIGADVTPAQNPHMHLYEACLQANRMTGDAIWLARAADLRALALKHFMDQGSGSIAEFLTPNLQPLPDAEGLRREIGHQCEWAWLLMEEAELAKNPDLGIPAARFMDFANSYGFAPDGPLKGAAFDAVSVDGDIIENSFLLWPQTEAIKMLAISHMAGDQQADERASALMRLMFEGWFADRPTFVNQLDIDGNPLWSQALTRLMYHLVLAMTEGARAKLWPDIPSGSLTCHNPT